MAKLAEHVAVLLDAGDTRGATARLVNASSAELDDVDLADVDELLARLPPSVVAASPPIRLLLARLCADAVQIERRTELLEELRRQLAELDADDRATAVGVRAELARDLARDGQPEEADALATEVLELAGPDDLYARAIACEVRGRAAAWYADSNNAFADARRWLEQGLAAARRLRSADLTAALLGFRGYRVAFATGRLDEAARDLADAADVIAIRPRRRSMLLTFLAEVEHYRGRLDLASEALDHAEAIGAELGDDRLLAYVAWERARGAGWSGRVDELNDCILAVRRHASDWFDHPTGMVFMAEMADLCDRLGDPVQAGRFLGDALARMAELDTDDPDVLLVAAAIEARHGDAQKAVDLLARIDAVGGLAPSRQWRRVLLGTLARARLHGRADPGLGAAAADAFDVAATSGMSECLSLVEPEAVEMLAGLAAAAGSATAQRLVEHASSIRIQLLGRFSVSRSGLRVVLPAGQPVQVVKLVATHGGQLAIDVAIDILWPEESPDNGRKLLRNVLTRLRRDDANAAELLVRDGDVLRTGDHVAIDLAHFDTAATRALALRGVDDEAAAAHARVAVADYRGDLLPEDRYEDWAVEARERTRGRYIALRRLLAAVAAKRGQVEEAVHHLERVIEAEPLDIDAHHQLIDLLAGHGRPAAADRARRRADDAERSLGVRSDPIR